MSENWIDQGAAPPLNAVLAAIDQGNISAINVYMGGRYAYLGGPNGNKGNPQGNGWTPAFINEIAAARPKVAFFGSWVSLVPGQGGYGLGHQDGLDAANTARGYPKVLWLSYDVEPGAFDANPVGAADAMAGFTDAVHSQGFLSMPYSVPRGLAAGAANADGIWIANPNPGGDDPTNQPLNPDFFAGRRSVQCCLLIAAGVDWDLSHSQFSVGGIHMTRDDWAAFYGAFIVCFLRDPPLIDANQPDGEDYFWADHTLAVGPRQAIREFLDALKKQAAVPIPLKDVDTVPPPATSVDQALRTYLRATPPGVGP
jgi:hypothetical protein